MKQPIRLFNGFPIEHATQPYRDFQNRSRRVLLLNELHFEVDGQINKLKWQTGGYARHGVCVDIKAPEAPSIIIEKPLIEVIEKVRPAKHYYLSANAAEGILRRVDSQNRTLFGPMDAALRKMARQNKPPKLAKSSTGGARVA